MRETFEYTQPVNPLWMKNMSVIMDQRRSDLERNCEILGLNVPGNDSLHKPNAWEFLINHQHHLVWCNVFKVILSLPFTATHSGEIHFRYGTNTPLETKSRLKIGSGTLSRATAITYSTGPGHLQRLRSPAPTTPRIFTAFLRKGTSHGEITKSV